MVRSDELTKLRIFFNRGYKRFSDILNWDNDVSGSGFCISCIFFIILKIKGSMRTFKERKSYREDN